MFCEISKKKKWREKFFFYSLASSKLLCTFFFCAVPTIWRNAWKLIRKAFYVKRTLYRSLFLFQQFSTAIASSTKLTSKCACVLRVSSCVQHNTLTQSHTYTQIECALSASFPPCAMVLFPCQNTTSSQGILFGEANDMIAQYVLQRQ